MRITQFQKDMINGRAVLPVCVFLFLLLRLHSGIDWLNIGHASVFLLHLLIAFLLLQVEHEFAVIRSRTVLPTVVYLLIAGTHLPAFESLKSVVVSFCFLLALTCCFASYQRKDAQRNAFNIAFLFAGCSLLWAPALLFLPFSWWALSGFRAFHLKSAIASFMGIFFVALLALCYGIYREDLGVALALLPSFGEMFSLRFEGWTAMEIARVSFTTLLTLFSFIHFMRKTYAERMRVRSYLFLLYVSVLLINLLMVFSSGNREVWFALLALFSSLAIAHYFSLSVKKFTSYVLLVSLLFYIATYFLSYYLFTDELFFNSTAWIDLISIF